jgi:predicted DNA-binding transcriptional regulator YafY
MKKRAYLTNRELSAAIGALSAIAQPSAQQRSAIRKLAGQLERRRAASKASAQRLFPHMGTRNPNKTQPRILKVLEATPCNVNLLTERLGVSRRTVARNLKQLCAQNAVVADAKSYDRTYRRAS